jgi:hypothetical protein
MDHSPTARRKRCASGFDLSLPHLGQDIDDEVQKAEGPEMKRTGGLFWFYSVLGVFFTVMALVSIIQHVFAVGLAPTLEVILETYRAMVHPIMDFLLGWVRWLFPQWTLPWWAKDMYALSFVGSAIQARSASEALRHDVEIGDPYHSFATVFMGFTFGLLGIGVIGVLGAVFFSVTYLAGYEVNVAGSDLNDHQRVNTEFNRANFYNTLAVVIGTLLFFGVSAFS